MYLPPCKRYSSRAHPPLWQSLQRGTLLDWAASLGLLGDITGSVGLSCYYLYPFFPAPITYFLTLRYNSHMIKFTLLEYVIQSFVVYSQGCKTITTIQIQTIFTGPSRSPAPVSSHSPPPAPGHHLLSVWICLFQTLHRSHTSVAFCV